MSKFPKETIWANVPSWMICCQQCGCQFNPRSMHTKTCDSCVAGGGVVTEEAMPRKTIGEVEYSELKAVKGENEMSKIKTPEQLKHFRLEMENQSLKKINAELLEACEESLDRQRGDCLFLLSLETFEAITHDDEFYPTDNINQLRAAIEKAKQNGS